MSKKATNVTKATTPSISPQQFRVEFVKVPGWDAAILPRLSELIFEANIPGMTRGKSSMPTFNDEFTVCVVEVGDFYLEKFFEWITKKCGDLAEARLHLLDSSGKIVKTVELNGLEITSISNQTFSLRSFIGTKESLEFHVTMKVGAMRWVTP